MRDIVLEYLDKKKFPYKIITNAKGEELANLSSCPICHEKGGTHCFIWLSTGWFYCHRCNAQGSFLTLKKHLGDIAETVSFEQLAPVDESPQLSMTLEDVEKNHQLLLADKETLWYLSSRHFTLEAVKYFKLGVSYENGVKWLHFPYIASGMLKNIKMRTLPPAKKGFRRLDGGESSLFNEEILKTNPEYIIIAEGESDTVALWSKGFKNVVGVSVGAGGIKPEWIDQLDKIPRFVIAYDNDDAGQEGGRKLAKRLEYDRCTQIEFPNGIKDINEFFMKGRSAAEFQLLIDNAKPFGVEGVQSLADILKQNILKLRAGNKEDKLELPWKKVNQLLDGFVPGDLIVLGAKTGVGKSSFSFNILYHYAMMSIPVLLISLEMPLWRIMPRLVALHKHKDSRQCNDAQTLSEAYRELKHVPLYISYKYKKPTWDFIADTIRDCVRRYGTQFVVFDNLHFLCRSLTHATEEISVTIQNFKLLAEELAIPIMVIARPRKTTSKIIDEEDLKGSIDIAGDADIIITLSREKKKGMYGEDVEGVYDPSCTLMAIKVRYAPGGSTRMLVDDKECRWEEG